MLGDFLPVWWRDVLLDSAMRAVTGPAVRETWIWFLGWEVPWSRKWQPTPVFLPGESHRGAWWATVHGITRVGHDLALSFFFLMRNVPFMHMVLNVLHQGVLSVMWTEWGATRLEWVRYGTGSFSLGIVFNSASFWSFPLVPLVHFCLMQKSKRAVQGCL